MAFRTVTVVVLGLVGAGAGWAGDRISSTRALEADLLQLCDVIGGRPSGSAAMRRSVDWAVEALRSAGVDEVHTEPFLIPLSWSEGETRVEVLAPGSFSIEAAATAWSPATPAEGLELELVDGRRGARGQVRRLGERVRGKAVLIRLEEVESFEDLGIEQRNAIFAMREAAEVGAAAVLLASTRPDQVLLRHIHSVNGTLDPLPSAVLAREEVLRLGRLLDDGHEVRVRVTMPNRIGGEFESRNVVGEIRGSRDPEQVVILGAHLDSWGLGSGCLDNGVNVALVLEVARAIAAGPRPGRTVRFVLFGGEEQGLFGSRAYVRDHRDELDDVAAVLVHDMGQGRIQGYSLGGRAELEEGLQAALEPLGRDDWDHPQEAFFGSDHFDFMLEGVPALVAIQDTSDYVLPYHAETDTYDKVDLEMVRDRARVAAAAAFGLANAPERLGRRLKRGEVGRLLRRTQLDDQMRLLGLWEEWRDGERGRSR